MNSICRVRFGEVIYFWRAKRQNPNVLKATFSFSVYFDSGLVKETFHHRVEHALKETSALQLPLFVDDHSRSFSGAFCGVGLSNETGEFKDFGLTSFGRTSLRSQL